jgi:hypothetical protein
MYVANPSATPSIRYPVSDLYPDYRIVIIRFYPVSGKKAIRCTPNSESDDGSLSSSDEDVNDKSGCSKTYERQQSSSKMNFPNVARACDRNSVPDRCAASIVSATLQDVGILNAADLSMVVDRSKVRRERCKLRRRLQGGQNSPHSKLYFDGQKDRTEYKSRRSENFTQRLFWKSISVSFKNQTHGIWAILLL